MQYEVSEAQIKGAKHPHEIFLINLITNHILLFVGLLGMAKTFPWLLLVTPSISFVVLGYIMIRARSMLTGGDWYTVCHWQLCAHRGMWFILILLILGLAITLLMYSADWSFSNLTPQKMALGGFVAMPTLISVLVLIVMESDAVHKAKSGFVPQWLVDKYPNPAARPLSE
ncbi:MAG: hypothetical protein OEZ16_05840 [Chromatiales bacterium]|nr:hypothetical protein [Chromatiales bacterium]